MEVTFCDQSTCIRITAWKIERAEIAEEGIETMLR